MREFHWWQTLKPEYNIQQPDTSIVPLDPDDISVGDIVFWRGRPARVIFITLAQSRIGIELDGVETHRVRPESLTRYPNSPHIPIRR